MSKSDDFLTCIIKNGLFFLLKDLNPNLSVLHYSVILSNSFYVCKNGNFFQCVAKKKFWYFVGCSQKVLLGSTKKGNFLKRKELTFLFSFFLLRILAIHQNPFSFPLAAFLFFSFSTFEAALVDPNKAGSIWILYASARNRAILRSFTAAAGHGERHCT